VSPQGHLDRLSAIDAGFLAQEKPNTHMHIGALALLEGPPPTLDEFLAHIDSRLHLVPRYRQKLAIPPLQTGRPLWIDDPTFNLAYHVRHTALPAPGDEAALLTLCGRIFAQRIDRSKPLWELWLVEGLDDGSCAMITKTHHSVVDGISGVDLNAVLFDLSPEGQPEEAKAPAVPWAAQPEPGPALLAARGLEDAARAAAGLAAGAVTAATHPEAALDRAREVAAGIGELALNTLSAPPETPFNVPPGPHRRIAIVRAGLDEFKEVKNAFGATVNDVVLAVVTGALAFFLQERGRNIEGLELKACVPVSIRAEGASGSLGNHLTQIMAPLPVFMDDPVERLHYVHEAMADLKDSRQAMAASAIASLQDFAPPTLHAQASRMNFSGRFFNLLVTNVPGPQFPLYVLGRKLESMFPIAFLAGDRALAIAIMSYDGAMNFGLLGDFDALPDLALVAEGIEASLAQLVGLARGAVPVS
jgi:diacylglycerol O-acyltransferase